MREYIIASLILFFMPLLPAQTVPDGWQIVKDSKNACRIAVPADWSLYGETQSAAIFQDSTTALAIVTSQPGQEFHPLPENLLRVLDIPQGKLFENSATRIFYQDRRSSGPGDPTSYSFSVPSKSGTCSGHLTFLSSISEELARKIALSLAPIAASGSGSN